MKDGKTALLCLALCLLVLFGCAQEAGIPEGWVEYDLPEAGVKIALPPDYVAAFEGTLPTDADYERAGIAEEDRERYREQLQGSFEVEDIALCAVSPETEDRYPIIVTVTVKGSSQNIRDRNYSLNRSNVDELRELLSKEAENAGRKDLLVMAEKNFLGKNHAFVVLSKTDFSKTVPIHSRQYITIRRGRMYEVVFAIAERDNTFKMIMELEEIVNLFSIR